LPLSEKVRIEIFIPDLPDPAYRHLLEELAGELTYAFGGCTLVSAKGKYRSPEALVVSDKICTLFSDAQLWWERDRLALERCIDWLKRAAERALKREEEVLVSVYSVCHGE
jgi:hypothetical protein